MSSSAKPASGPEAFEELVAADFRKHGYDARVRGGTNDWGIDIFASKGEEKVGIQAKMYARSREVNRRQIFELYGAARYFDCTRIVLATDGSLASDAAAAAEKLGIEVWHPSYAATRPAPPTPGPCAARTTTLPSFDTMWEQWVMPLAGLTLTRADGTSNRIVAVDWSGVTRITSGGNRARIPIEPFRWAVERIKKAGSVTRDQINHHYEKRASKGIVLILSRIPLLRVVDDTIYEADR